MLYPILMSNLSDRRKQKFEIAIGILQKSLQEGMIRNTDYLSIKDDLNRAVDEGFKKGLPSLKTELCSKEIADLYWKSIMSLHDIVSAHKQVSKIEDRENEYVKAYQAAADELIQLALDVKFMKDKIVKGRDPSKKKEIVVNPNKIIRTCSCCFREIALSKSGHMVHHGFQRPGDGYQTDSCFGISYKPLERSNEGLVAIIDVIEKQLEHKNSAYKKLEISKEVSFVNEKTKKVVLLSEENEDFNKMKSQIMERILSEIKQLNFDLKIYKDKLKNWRQTEFIYF